MLRHVIVGVLVLVAGCDDESTALQGVYRLDTATSNTAACDVEGPSTLDQHAPYLFIELQTFITQEFVSAVECADVAACQAEAATDTVSLDYGFDRGNDADGWTSRSIFASGAGGACSGAVTDFLLADTDGGVRLEARRRVVTFTAADCTTEAAEAAADDVACSQLDVVTASFVASL